MTAPTVPRAPVHHLQSLRPAVTAPPTATVKTAAVAPTVGLNRVATVKF